MKLFNNLIKIISVAALTIMLAQTAGAQSTGGGQTQLTNYPKTDAKMHAEMTKLKNKFDEIKIEQRQRIDIIKIMHENYGDEGVTKNSKEIEQLVMEFMQVEDDYAQSVAEQEENSTSSSVELSSGFDFIGQASDSSSQNYGTTQTGLTLPMTVKDSSASKDITSLAEQVSGATTDYLNQLDKDRTLFKHSTALEGFATALSVRKINITAKEQAEELNEKASACTTLRCDVQVLTAATLQTAKRIAQLQALDALIGQVQAVNTATVLKLEE